MSPATPATGTSAFSKFAVVSHSIEPSPASTYGASDAGDDMLLTPDNDGVPLDLSNLAIRDEDGAGVTIESTGGYHSSAKKGKTAGIAVYSPPFVRNGSNRVTDDVFQTSTPVKDASPNRSATDNWRSGSTNETPSRSHGQVKRFDDRSFGTTQRRLSFGTHEIVTIQDAQAVYPPSCCVFVANLAQGADEEELEERVGRVFGDYGRVFVKIRRDPRNMPFAFCQYTKKQDADNAIQHGKGRFILGRPCRTERAKAHRLFFLERKFGPLLTLDEAVQIVEPYGPIESCHAASAVERASLNLNEGIVVQFRMYEHGQNALLDFRTNPDYKFTSIAGMATPNRHSQGARMFSPSSCSVSLTNETDIETRSIFVGNLPLGTKEEKLRGLFAACGGIKEVTVRETPSRFDPTEKLTFAFIEFTGSWCVNNALANKDAFTIGSTHLRVEAKDSESAAAKKHAARARVVNTPSRVRRSEQTSVQPTVTPTTPAPAAFGTGSGYAMIGNPFGTPFMGSPYGPQNIQYWMDPNGKLFYTPVAYSPYQSPYGYGQFADNTTSPTSMGFNGLPFGYSAPAFGLTAPAVGGQGDVAHPPAYSVATVSSSAPVGEDRAATPTPGGNGIGAPSLESA